MVDTKVIQVGDRQVLLMDFSHLRDAALATATDDAIATVRSVTAPHSVLALLDLTGTPANRTLLTSLRKLSENNGPFIRAMAFTGLSPIPRSLLKALLRFSGRANHEVFLTRNEALDWLTGQPMKAALPT